MVESMVNPVPSFGDRRSSAVDAVRAYSWRRSPRAEYRDDEATRSDTMTSAIRLKAGGFLTVPARCVVSARARGTQERSIWAMFSSSR